MVNEDIFLSMQVKGSRSGQESLHVLIKPNGDQKKIDLTGISGLPIVAGVQRGDSTCLYYLDRVEKTVVLSTLVIDENTGASSKLTGSIPVPGMIYGSYVEGNDLYMLCAVKNEYKLRLFQMRNGVLRSASEFPLTFNLGKRKNQLVTFMDMANPVSPLDAVGQVKICKDGRAIWILVDEAYSDRDVTVTENSLFRTTAIKLDLDKQTTIVKSFYEPERSGFVSAVLGNSIYRWVLSSGRIDEFDFISGKKKNSVLVPGLRDARLDSTYVHINDKFKIEKSVKGKTYLDHIFGWILVVDSLSNGERVFTLGLYGDNHSPMVLAYGVPIIGTLIIAASSLVVSQLAPSPVTAIYYYYRGYMDQSVTATYNVPFLRKKVDDFGNRQLKNKVFFDFRGYLNMPETTYEVTQQHNSKVVEIRKFKFEESESRFIESGR